MKVLVTGAGGMLGRALTGAWRELGRDDELIGITRAAADLRDARVVSEAVERIRPDVIVHTAARVGGIGANIAAPAQFLSDNLRIDTSVIGAALHSGVEEFVYLGSSCMYPRDYRQPLVETDILQAPLEPTNEGYAIAKIAGAKLCAYTSREHSVNYRVIIPSNLYGPYDHFGSMASHLVAAALHKAHLARQSGDETIDVWGDGTARREFTYVGDLAGWIAENIGHVAEWPDMMNVGIGKDYSVREFYEAALRAVNYRAELRFDPSKPAGMMQKLMDSSLARQHGWDPRTDIDQGMARTYTAYLESATA
ncbi:NAD-dependent epimerase/dehydratase family protein [Mycolicibacterium sp. CH28]|uniref:NAD-dependent epimerase/dehydratase family protein n=1 Tax=Mycolicibacterium sp. CH28 TaxID=2512237 RepID=UPI001386E7FC|nr:NAD-dependent epimerase/dehydratase family protein [Mycolicibacterium sp. CH28]